MAGTPRPRWGSHFQGALLGLALMMSIKDRGVPVFQGVETPLARSPHGQTGEASSNGCPASCRGVASGHPRSHVTGDCVGLLGYLVLALPKFREGVVLGALTGNKIAPYAPPRF